MNISEAFPSEYLKADDLKAANSTVTISEAVIEEIGQGQQKESKLILAFVGKKKRLVLNKTNAKVIAGLYGNETEDWKGKQITLCPREVEFQGDMVWAIRVSLQKPVAGQERGTDRSPAPAKQAPNEENQLAEDCPF